MSRRLRLWAPLAISAVAVALSAAPVPAEARPGGGQSYKGGGGSRSSGGSSRSSGGSSRSSGGSRSSDSRPSTPSPPPAPPITLHRAVSGKGRMPAEMASLSAISTMPVTIYGLVPRRPAEWTPRNELESSTVASVLFVVISAVLGGVGLVAHAFSQFFRKKQGSGWSTATTTATGRSELDAIRQTDPDFSIALFEDFLYALFAEAHMARGAGTLERLSPYLRPAARQALAAQARAPVSSVIVGAMRFVGFSTSDPHRFGVTVELEANYAEQAPGGPEHAFWVTERWTLSRARTARSRPPARSRVFDCPGCGGALDKMVGGTCRYCNRVVDTGEFDWVVESIVTTHREQRGPMLTGTTEEQGTDLPTVLDPQLQTRLAALRAKDPSFDPNAFQARVGMVFATMQQAWTSLEWDRARPFLSDNLFHAQRYWIDSYRRAGLRNVTERPRIFRMEVARVTQDRWFDAITVRVYATGLDYTVRVVDGAVVGGDRGRERTYTEYWTLLRGVTAHGAARTQPVCPQCGGSLDISMAGACKHCNAKVNSGEFDWVLARIEQDDVYAG